MLRLGLRERHLLNVACALPNDLLLGCGLGRLQAFAEMRGGLGHKDGVPGLVKAGKTWHSAQRVAVQPVGPCLEMGRLARLCRGWHEYWRRH